jgi:hypothetical protein
MSGDGGRTLTVHSEFGRLLLAMMVTPVVPAFYGTCFFAQPWVMAVVLPYAYAAELFIGLPLILWFRHRHQRSPFPYACAGFVCTLPLLLAYARIGSPPHFAPFDGEAALDIVGGGVLSGLTFWLLSVAGEAPVTWRELIDPRP